MNIFEIATRKKYRFPYKGNISVEDLWSLSLESLDGVYRALNQTYNQMASEVSLLHNNLGDEDIRNKIEIVRYIVQVKLSEKQAALAEKRRAEEKQKILSVLKQRDDDKYNKMSDEELISKLNSL